MWSLHCLCVAFSFIVDLWALKQYRRYLWRSLFCSPSDGVEILKFEAVKSESMMNFQKEAVQTMRGALRVTFEMNLRKAHTIERHAIIMYQGNGIVLRFFTAMNRNCEIEIATLLETSWVNGFQLSGCIVNTSSFFVHSFLFASIATPIFRLTLIRFLKAHLAEAWEKRRIQDAYSSRAIELSEFPNILFLFLSLSLILAQYLEWIHSCFSRPFRLRKR